MKKKKKILIFILIILIVLAIGACGAYFYFDKAVVVEVKEISILQQEFKIESELYQVVLSDDDDDFDSGANGQMGNSIASGGSGTTSTGNRSYSGGGGYGTSTYVGVATASARIQIPRTGVNLPLYAEVTVKNMERGAVILSSDNGLNEPGNTVISGHNTVNGRLFSKNAKIQIGDLIYITDPTGTQRAYSVYNKYITSPNDASYVDRDTGGAREISLTTCTDNAKQRIIIWAREI